MLAGRISALLMSGSRVQASRQLFPALARQLPQFELPTVQLAAMKTSSGPGYAQEAGSDAPEPRARSFADFTVYKSKGALSATPVLPRWNQLASGAWQMEREGSFMFDVAAASGERKYNWEQKIKVALTPVELATIFTAPQQEHTFYHDTFKGQAGKEGTLVKTFRWSAAPDGGAYFINVSMTDKTEGQDKRASASVSLTPAELYILQKLFDACLPALYGIDMVLQSG